MFIVKGVKIMTTYTIKRYYSELGKPPRTIKKGVSLAEAQEHCSKASTIKKFEWFDGFTRE
jgi:hypothetical protein